MGRHGDHQGSQPSPPHCPTGISWSVTRNTRRRTRCSFRSLEKGCPPTRMRTTTTSHRAASASSRLSEPWYVTGLLARCFLENAMYCPPILLQNRGITRVVARDCDARPRETTALRSSKNAKKRKAKAARSQFLVQGHTTAIVSVLRFVLYLCVCQVKTWGILWRPLAVPLKHQTRVLHSIGRLHNFLRRLNDDPPEAPGQPGIVNGILEDQVWKPPMTPGGGRAAAASSNTRNEIVETIARRGLRRPAHNVAEDNHP